MSLGREDSRRLVRAATARELGSYARLEGRKLFRLLLDGRFGAFLGSLAEVTSGRNPYYDRRVAGGGRYRCVSIGDGHRLLVDAEDAGISRTLLAYGVHEYCSRTVFERELDAIAADVDGQVTVLEAGANVGYYCLLEAGVLGDRARIYAVEPVPSNVRLLELNIALNDYDDLVFVDRFALGAEPATVEMAVSTHSNQHRVCPAPGSKSIQVSQVTGDGYLQDNGVDPAAVNVVRTDVEGYERDLLEGLATVLEAPGPTLLFVEVHPLDLSSEAATVVTALLEEHDFSIVSAVRTDAAAGIPDGRRWHGIPLGCESVDDLRRAMAESDHSIEVIARK